MTKSSNEFIEKEFLKEFTGASSLLNHADELGQEVGRTGFNQLFFVGCGAPHAMMKAVAYWGDHFAANTNIRVYHAAEFVHLDPASLNKKTIVFLGSHSGTTREVVEAADYLSIKPCRTIAFSQFKDSILGKKVDDILDYGSSKQGYFFSLMLTMAFTSAFLKENEKNWDIHYLLMDSLINLPAALADAKEISIEKGKDLAKKLQGANPLYIIGSGPMYTTAYIYAACFLMEMQWMHAFPLSSAEFFHGPFEVFEADTPLVLLLGEDPSRSEAERVLSFCRKYTCEPFMYDSREYTMNGIHEKIRPYVAPFIVDAAMTNIVEHLALINQHPLSTRRYMGKVDY